MSRFAVVLALSLSVAAPPVLAADCSTLTVTATNDGPTCEGAPVTLTAAMNAANPSFHWQCLNCGGPIPGVNYDVQSLTVNNFGRNWEVIVTDNATGCVARASTTPGVDSRPRISAPVSWCAGDGDITATISNDDPSNPYANLTWYVTGGVITSGQGTKTITVHPTVEYPNHVDVSYDVAATNARGCSFPRSCCPSTLTNARPEQPLFDLQAPPNVCGDGMIRATLVPTTTIYTLGWSAINATLVFCQRPPTTACFRADGMGPATISAMYTTMSEPDCPRTVSRTVSVGRSSNMTIMTDATACANHEQTASVAESGSGATYAWSVTNGIITSGQGTPSITYTASGDAVLSVDVSANGCASSASAAVQMSDRPRIVSQSKSVTAVAAGSTATLAVEAEGNNLVFQWYQGARGDTSHPIGLMSGTLMTAPVVNSTSYWVRVFNACGFADSETMTVTPAAAARHRPARH